MTDQDKDKEYLRDFFAGFAMCGLIINNKYTTNEVALMSYKMAEAMIDAKEFMDVGIKGVRKKRSSK